MQRERAHITSDRIRMENGKAGGVWFSKEGQFVQRRAHLAQQGADGNPEQHTCQADTVRRQTS